ncbi:hypothetical protein OG912_01510 [Streptomyces sp. NBC_00464]|uniref:hypothetical protein n=1 Tax=Streptomyces sp. NBC_00464 TaxID=2975751 RepID=UPI002E195A4D
MPVVLAPETTADELAVLEAGNYRVFHGTDALRRCIGHLRAEQTAARQASDLASRAPSTRALQCWGPSQSFVPYDRR